MRLICFRHLMIFALTLILAGGTASAHTYTWLGLFSPQWTNPLNWISLTGTAYPGASACDIAIIGCPLIYDSVLDTDIAIRGMTIGNCGRVWTNGHDLEITGASSLTIHNFGELILNEPDDQFILSGGGKAEIAGVVELIGYRSRLRFESSIEICGVGSENGLVLSELDDNGIIFANGISVGSTLVFFGSMYFEASNSSGTHATFRNYGLVSAELGGRIDLYRSIKLLDSADATHWRARGAALAFHRASDGSDADHPALTGDFDVNDCGELHIAAGVQLVTGGDFQHMSGSILFSDGGYVDIGSYYFEVDFTSLDCND